MKNSKNFKFIDLFAGIGGFHLAMRDLGGTCVCASEIDPYCVERYKKNFPKTKIIGDINKHIDNLPQFEVLCAGFPCQPFSKAGKQKGFNDGERGNLFYTIVSIIKKHPECKFVILENVKNLADKTENWNLIQEAFRELNFYITEKPIILSPHQFGIPQRRERVYILGIRKDIRDISKLPNGFIHMDDFRDIISMNSACTNEDAKTILENNPDDLYRISKSECDIIEMWMNFKQGTIFDKPHVPLWVEYFGYGMTDKEYETFTDHNGKTINEIPDWKRKFALKNRAFYLKHKTFVDKWIEEYDVLNLPLSFKKFEWNCGDNQDIKKTIIQFRQSGIRVKRLDYFPALVAIDNTPIIFDEEKGFFRRITPREAANLQSFSRKYILECSNCGNIYKQLGNAVNTKVIFRLTKKLFSFQSE